MDYYSQRLSEKKTEKEARLSKTNLPLGRPPQFNSQNTNSGLKTMAGNPNTQPEDPHAGVAGSDFKNIFDNLSKDGNFKSGMAEFATIMKTMQKDMQGLNLPPEVMRRRVEQVVNQYAQGSKPQVGQSGGAMGEMVPQQPVQGGGFDGQ